MIEKEVLIYDIDPSKIRAILKKHGAKLSIKCKQINQIFALNKKNPSTNVLRVRSEGKTTYLTYLWKLPPKGLAKQAGHYGTKISNKNEFLNILKEFNFKELAYMEKKIERYQLKNIIFEIRHIPNIPPHLEIESTTLKNIKTGLKLLGLSESDSSKESFYKKYNLEKKKRIKF